MDGDRTGPIYRDVGGELVEVPTTEVAVGDDSYTYEVTYDDSGSVLRFCIATQVEKRNGVAVVAGDPVTATALRGLSLTAIVRANAAAQTRHPAQTPAWIADVAERHAAGRRARLDDHHYASVADLYVKALGRGSARVIEDVAAELSYSYGTVRNHVSEARRRKLLSETERGKSGGHLTPKAIALLEENT